MIITELCVFAKLSRTSNSLDIAFDKCGVNGNKSCDLGWKGFLQIDHPFQLDQLHLLNSEVVSFGDGTLPHWYCQRKLRNNQINRSHKALGKLYDHMREKIRILVASSMRRADHSFMNPHVLKVISQFKDNCFELVPNASSEFLKLLQ